MARQTDTYNDREFWIHENTAYAAPNFRVRRCARILNEMTRGRPCDLLDVGCGPAALRPLLGSHINYHGIDIALHQRAPYLRETDFVQNEIVFEDKRFDVVVALGVFEYMGSHQSRKFAEIHRLMNPGGAFVMSYINFRHFRRIIYPIYNNVQSIAELTASLRQVFQLEQCFPVSHHWRHKQPGGKAAVFQLPGRRSVPLVSSWLSVEYFCICSRRA
jgi:2-polyprenyl-3-methyl-5-hydroxy-6-metoxy-1,4-benzoquinol methylase